MKKLLILSCLFTAILLTTSCTSESIEDDEIGILNDDIHQTPVVNPPINPPIYPPGFDHGDDDKDKDKGHN